jgi:hypothetical protein
MAPSRRCLFDLQNQRGDKELPIDRVTPPQIGPAILFSRVAISTLIARHDVSNDVVDRKSEITFHGFAIPTQPTVRVFVGAIEFGADHHKRANNRGDRIDAYRAFHVLRTDTALLIRAIPIYSIWTWFWFADENVNFLISIECQLSGCDQDANIV